MSFAKDSRKMTELRQYAIDRLSELNDSVRLNLPPLSAPHVISVTVFGIKSQTILNHLSAAGICVSSGSACSSHSNKPSHVLLAYGLSERDADSTVRISLSRYNTKEDIDALVDCLGTAISRLVRMKR
ncbi:MAG: aminotransferase class V-fold PLP-dependent enzyme [Clostridia bacterium]|nr:aminotransferase class V-fold PLP-dependent enzyme [Clostridia bacterium]